jgi:hypothetical protein
MLNKAVIGLLLAVALIAARSALADPWQIDASPLESAPVRYARYSSLREFAVPVIAWRRSGLASGAAEIERIKAQIIYPAIVESVKPVVAMVVEFQPANPQAIGILMIWADGEGREALIPRNEGGHYDRSAYKVLFAKPTP